MEIAVGMIENAFCVHFIIFSCRINSPSRLQGGKQQCFPTSIIAFFKITYFVGYLEQLALYTVQVNY